MEVEAERGILRLATSDFWPGFRPTDSFFWRALAPRFRLELDDRAPLLVYSVFGANHRLHRGAKILCTGEPDPLPPRTDYDYSIGWQLRDDERHVRVPMGLWNPLRFPDVAASAQGRDWAAWAERPFFCNFVYSNPRPSERREFLAELSRRRFVHSPGSVDTNSPRIEGGRDAYDWWRRKLAYLRQFRFTIAFESHALPGYTSEKLVDALLAGSVPIYWGNPEVDVDVDPRSFVAASDFGTYAELADYVVRLDDNRDDVRPFLAGGAPLRHELEEVADSVGRLFERARDDRGVTARASRTLRPIWLTARGGGVRARAARLRRLASLR